MSSPLAETLRPTHLSEIVGQDHLLGKEGFITRLVEQGTPLSILLWGPPGCGKTTLARLYAQAFQAEFISFSAVFQGVQEIKKVVEESKKHPLFQTKKIVFVDEIHRFNKAQQDAFLPFIEDGTFILVGATTENPSFALNKALLSRLRVLTLNTLDKEGLEKIVQRYEKTYGKLPLEEKARLFLIEQAQGDGRHLLNLIENLFPQRKASLEKQLALDDVAKLLQKRTALYDKHGEGHFNLISALHKAVRGSDPQAALYYFTRMLEGGEAVEYIARRMVRMAVEDIGLADPEALQLTLNAWKAYDQLGSPEGELALAGALIYLSLAPKSNATYVAFKKAKAVAEQTTNLAPPAHILNAPTALLKELGYGKDYQYDHDTPEGFSGQNYFPEGLETTTFYEPTERGFERELKRRLQNCFAQKNQ